ncbi:transcriptional regulator [Streptomyces sp. NPDC059496]|uniref:transcriptional regulator n=1 Tax=Streptomyces sp. NPDC059496 TaxID=3346851 RepID=UPI0036C694C5
MPVPDAGFDDAVLYRMKFARRLPAALAELTGPEHGVVELPLHVVWSGLRAFDLDQPRQRMGLYRTVLAEGTREDLCRFLNAELLTSLWPVLRTLAGPSIRAVWENAFPELQERAAV